MHMTCLLLHPGAHSHQHDNMAWKNPKSFRTHATCCSRCSGSSQNSSSWPRWPQTWLMQQYRPAAGRQLLSPWVTSSSLGKYHCVLEFSPLACLPLTYISTQHITSGHNGCGSLDKPQPLPRQLASHYYALRPSPVHLAFQPACHFSRANEISSKRAACTNTNTTRTTPCILLLLLSE